MRNAMVFGFFRGDNAKSNGLLEGKMQKAMVF
jgi:hypothetical protein